jgi:hypothetical protein
MRTGAVYFCRVILLLAGIFGSASTAHAQHRQPERFAVATAAQPAVAVLDSATASVFADRFVSGFLIGTLAMVVVMGSWASVSPPGGTAAETIAGPIVYALGVTGGVLLVTRQHEGARPVPVFLHALVGAVPVMSAFAGGVNPTPALVGWVLSPLLAASTPLARVRE